jgi:hypothetical protein
LFSKRVNIIAQLLKKTKKHDFLHLSFWKNAFLDGRIWAEEFGRKNAEKM